MILGAWFDRLLSAVLALVLAREVYAHVCAAPSEGGEVIAMGVRWEQRRPRREGGIGQDGCLADRISLRKLLSCGVCH